MASVPQATQSDSPCSFTRPSGTPEASRICGRRTEASPSSSVKETRTFFVSILNLLRWGADCLGTVIGPGTGNTETMCLDGKVTPSSAPWITATTGLDGQRRAQTSPSRLTRKSTRAGSRLRWTRPSREVSYHGWKSPRFQSAMLTTP